MIKTLPCVDWTEKSKEYRKKRKQKIEAILISLFYQSRRFCKNIRYIVRQVGLIENFPRRWFCASPCTLFRFLVDQIWVLFLTHPPILKKRHTHLSAQICFTDVLAEGNSNLSQNSPLLRVQRICRKIRWKRSKMLWQVSIEDRIPPSSRVSTEMTFRDLDFNKFSSFSPIWGNN